MILKFIWNQEKTFLTTEGNITVQPNETIEVSQEVAMKLLHFPFSGKYWEIIS